MWELVDRILYVSLKMATWQVFYHALFSRGSEKSGFPLSKQVLLLLGLRLLYALIAKFPLAPLVLMTAFFFVLRRRCERGDLVLAVQVVFSYFAAELCLLLFSFLSTVLCVLGLRVEDDLAITLVCGGLLTASWCLLVLLGPKRGWLPRGGPISTGILALLVSLFLSGFWGLFIPYVSQNRDFYVSSLFNMGICIALFFLWLWRDDQALEQKIFLHTTLEETTRERDDLLRVNHRLGKLLSELERGYRELENRVGALGGSHAAEEFHKEVREKRETFSALLAGVTDSRGRVDRDMGTLILNHVIQYVAEASQRQGVSFRCRIFTKANLLLRLSGMNELSLQQLLRNLLDNALHAAAKAEREPKMVQCVMGMTEDGYQIDVYDSGEPFPPEILANLGRIGNTTDGNGVGLVDVLEVAAACGASLFIVAFDEPLGTGATKRVAVRFDGEGMAHLPLWAGAGPTQIPIKALLSKRNE